jgi:hypothetical protein
MRDLDEVMPGYAFFEGRSKDERFLKNINAVRKELHTQI